MRIRSLLSLAAVMVIVVSGCRGKSKVEDKAFARQVIDALYARNCNSIQTQVVALKSLNETIAQSGYAAKRKYGAVRGLEFKSAERMKYGLKKVIWTVSAERGSFDVTILMDKGDKIAAIGVFNPITMSSPGQ